MQSFVIILDYRAR